MDIALWNFLRDDKFFNSLIINHLTETLHLLPQRAVWWPGQKILILSDLHAGKAAHFRKAGIPLPQTAFDADLMLLSGLIEKFQPESVIITGDLFHSTMNREVEAFKPWRGGHATTEFVLVPGNHDRYEADVYKYLGLTLTDELQIGPFRFSHHPPESIGDSFCFCGHIHPGIALSGRGFERLRLPCFYFTQHYAILPAFSRLTGMALVNPEQASEVYIILEENRVVALKENF